MSRLLNKTLYVRTLSGIALLIVVLGTVLWSPYSMLALGVFLTAGIMREFYRIGRLTGARPLTTYPIVVGAAIVVLAFLIKTGTLAPGLPSQRRFRRSSSCSSPNSIANSRRR